MSAKQKPRSTKRTLLGEFYRRDMRPAIASYSRSTLSNFDGAVAAAWEWRKSACVEDIYDAWLDEFERYLRATGHSRARSKTFSFRIRAIARQKYPYRFLDRVPWKQVSKVFAAEPAGYLGGYLATVIERDKSLSRKTLIGLRDAVTKFLRWKGDPVPMRSIDDQTLDEFERAEQSRPGVSRSAAKARRQRVAYVVNHWYPGRIRSRRNRPPLTPASKGTVQHFIEHTLVPAQSKKGRSRGRLLTLGHRLFSFNGSRHVAFSRLTPDFAERFIASLSSLSAAQINGGYIWPLNLLSREAAKQGLLPRPLKLDRLPDAKALDSRRRRREASTNGHAKAASNGAAKKSPTEKRPKSKVRVTGRPQKWAQLRAWLKERLAEGLDAKPADLRNEYRQVHPDSPLPKPGPMRAIVSELKAQESR